MSHFNKVGIITLNDYFNYGNRLQNFALQEILKDLQFETMTIVVDNRIHSLGKNKVFLTKLRKKSFYDLFNSINYRIKRFCTQKKYGELLLEREEIFKDFTKRHISESNYTISQVNLHEIKLLEYDYFVTGSDQVWNPNYIGKSSLNFLTFAESNKRIAYAPSFGVSEIEKQHSDNYKKWLSGINKISVREEDGAKIIKKLTGREAQVLVDPTILLSKERWVSISKPAANKPNKKYLLTYFLGGVPKEYKKQIDELLTKHDLEIINLGDIKEEETYKTGPSEFIDYINSCSMFCTDSFHGVVFSILFEKPFIVYERIGKGRSMFSRIDTILNKFDLKERTADNIDLNDVFEIDYSHTPFILEKEREKSINYLKDALNLNN